MNTTHSSRAAASSDSGLGGLPNYWQVFGLTESPFFQATLGDEPARYPLRLFVGRKTETRQLLAGVGGASSSRQALGGAPGVGKTTLVQLVKATAVQNGYWATRDLIPFHAGDTVELVLGRILGGVYETVLTARPTTAEHTTMQRAQQYVRAFRLTGGGANVSMFGVGGGATRTTAAITPPAGLMLDGPRVIHELLDLAGEAGAHGVVLHLNNLENLSDRDLRNAADILRSLRDPVLLQNGLHVILVGTTEAVSSTIMTHAQLRSVFSIQTLGPLPIGDVQALLAARYKHLAIDSATKVLPPVTERTVGRLYALFRGDLRGLLKALEEGVSLLVGLVGKHPGAPIPLDALREVLQARYFDILSQTLSSARQRQLQAWATTLGPAYTPTQDELKTLWRVSQPAVSQALSDLGATGYVIPLPRRGLEPGKYAFTGVSRLIFA